VKRSIEVIEDMRHSYFLKIQKLIAIIFCCLPLAGCMLSLSAYEAATYKYTTIKPNELDIIGTWNATSSSLDDMHNRGHYDYVTPRITILSNHTFVMKNIPDWLFNGSGKSHKKFITGSGRWELFQLDKEEGGGWGVNFSSKYGWAMLVGNEPPYSLEFSEGNVDESEGDVDERNFMDFER
jgi:hypothetical protein